MRDFGYEYWDGTSGIQNPVDTMGSREESGEYYQHSQETTELIMGGVAQYAGRQPSALQQQRAQPGPFIPHGYELRSASPSDRYDILYSRDYTRISFGTLVTEDYRQVIPITLPLGSRDDTPDPLLTGLPTHDEARMNSERAGDYVCGLALKPLPEAIKKGVDLDLIMTKREQTFCNDFLGFMAVLNHNGAESLQVGGTFSGRIAQTLGQLLRPARWTKVSWNKRACEATGEKPLSSAYSSFLGRIATDVMINDPPKRIKAYPLQKLNADTWLYLCEDGKARVKVGSDMLLPPPPPGFANGPTASLSHEYGEMRGLTAVRVSTELVNKTNGETRPFQTHVFPGSVLSYPPKQRLVDIAGRALTQLSTQATA
ncbi:MAG TPA: hypothetical protein VFT16_01890 [Candidatus Saccharimonadales bacterium]|nr:hypothetical protein [Candidatus Saccharimonadales bacterium]